MSDIAKKASVRSAFASMAGGFLPYCMSAANRAEALRQGNRDVPRQDRNRAEQGTPSCLGLPVAR